MLSRPRHHLEWAEVRELATRKVGRSSGPEDGKATLQAIRERPQVTTKSIDIAAHIEPPAPTTPLPDDGGDIEFGEVA